MKNKNEHDNILLNFLNKIALKDFIWFIGIAVIFLTTISSFFKYVYQVGLFYKYDISLKFILLPEYSINDMLYSLQIIIIYFIIFAFIYSIFYKDYFKQRKITKIKKVLSVISRVVVVILLCLLTIYMTKSNPSSLYLIINVLTIIGVYFYIKNNTEKLFSKENINFLFETKTRPIIFIIIIIIVITSLYSSLNFISGRFIEFKPEYKVKINNETKIVLYNNFNKSILCDLSNEEINCDNIMIIDNINYDLEKYNQH